MSKVKLSLNKSSLSQLAFGSHGPDRHGSGTNIDDN